MIINVTVNGHTEPINTPQDSNNEMVVWIPVSIVLIVLTTGLLSVIPCMMWFYKKRHTRDTDEGATKYEMEDNPCYEVTAVKQTTDTETHLYETVKESRAK